MAWWRSVAALAVLVLALAWQVADSQQIASDEQTLKSAGVGTDAAALQDYFRKHIAAGERVRKLIGQLSVAAQRDKAVADLIKIGAASVPYLRQAQRGQGGEVRGAIQRCLKEVDKDPADAIPLAALRLLAQRRPDGASEVLLGYLPLATDDVLAQEVRATLAMIGYRDGKPDKALLNALNDKDPEIRAGVAEIIGKRSGRTHVGDLKRLLKDPDPGVRLRVAQVIAELRVADAVPVLIALLVELPAERALQAEAILQGLAGAQAPAVAIGDGSTRQKCHDAWAAWWNNLNNQAILDLFRNSTLTDGLREQIQATIRRLGSEDFDTRERATASLIRIGPAAFPLLLQAAKDPDPEVVDRVKKCMAQIQKDPVRSNPANASRLVALRKPAGAVVVLLAYLPFAHDDNAVDEVQSALNVLAYASGKPETALVQALDDKLTIRRTAAAVALCQEESGRQLPEVRRFLKDKDATVRLRVALALARQKDRDAIPVLVDLLADLPQEQLWPVEELLTCLADQPLPAASGKDDAARRRYRDAWAAWWRDHGNQVDLARLDMPPRLLGYTLIVTPNTGRVAEYSHDGKLRWELLGLAYPFDARVLPGGHVLVAEYQGRKVTERTLKNEVVWEKQIMWPIACQRLANGNTFIATRNQMLEVDRTGKDVYTITRKNHDVLSAQKLPGGAIGLITNAQGFTHLDTTGKQLSSFGIGAVHNYVQFDVLADGGILIPQQGTNKVVEFDADGKPRWEASIQFPYSAARLPNGRTLLALMNSNRVVELDRSGKVAWEQKTDSPPWRARRR